MATCKTCQKTVKWYQLGPLTRTCKNCSAPTHNWLFSLTLACLIIFAQTWMADTTENIKQLDRRSNETLKTLNTDQNLNLERIGALEYQIKALKAELETSSPKT